jgi:hypothetical protein
VVVQHGADATAHAREEWQSGSHKWEGMCLKAVRRHLGIAKEYECANEAWEKAYQRTVYRPGREFLIPFGAPVFSDRKMGSEFGHVFLAGGRFRNMRRIFWTNDQFGDGRITPVTIDFFTEHWGHHILGWTRDLNGVGIPYLEGK